MILEVMVILSFIGVAILLTLMPGPDILFVIAQSLSQNKKAGIATALGLCSGLVVHICASILGISALVYQSAFAFTMIKYIGAAYLLYLAWQAFKEKESDLMIRNQKSYTYKALYNKGIFMNLLNPKVSLFFLALFPQFIDETAGYVSLQMIVLGLIFIIQALVIFTAVSVLAEKTSSLLTRHPFLSKRINMIKGLLLGLIGLQIAFSEK